MKRIRMKWSMAKFYCTSHITNPLTISHTGSLVPPDIVACLQILGMRPMYGLIQSQISHFISYKFYIYSILFNCTPPTKLRCVHCIYHPHRSITYYEIVVMGNKFSRVIVLWFTFHSFTFTRIII